MNDFSTRAKSYEKEADWILSEEFIRPLVPAPFGGRRLLDVCTGTGVIAEYAADLGWDVTAIDDNKDIIQYVDNRIAVVCHDANQLPFDDNSFDLIVSHLHHRIKIRIFPFERKVAYKYAILARSVLHIYAVGVYNYTFRPFAAHPFLPVCHILY